MSNIISNASKTQLQQTDEESYSNIELTIENGNTESTTIIENTIQNDNDNDKKTRSCKDILISMYKFFDRNYFMCMIFIAILFSALVPSAFRNGSAIRPEYLFGYGATILIFFISGVTLKTEALVSAIGNYKLNLFITFNIFITTTCIFYLLAMLLREISNANNDFIDHSLIDGIIILGCLPTTINMCVVMTTSSDGNISAALFNATFANILGIFISPIYIFQLLGVEGNISLSDVLLKLTYKVILPTIFGQIIQSLPYNDIKKYFLTPMKPYWKRTQETCLVLIVLNAFSNTFSSNISISIYNILIMFLCMGLTQIFIYILVWYTSSIEINNNNCNGCKCNKFRIKDRIAGLFCSTHKTLAMGIPLITTMYDSGSNNNVGLYTIPLLIYHPSQIIFGSIMAPYLREMVRKDEEDAGEEDAGEEGADEEGAGAGEEGAGEDKES